MVRFSVFFGYSEYYIGYVLDIGDGVNLVNDLKINFENIFVY